MTKRTHPLNYVKQVNNTLEVKVPRSALFEYFDEPLPNFIPTKIKDFSEIIRVSIDIETTGLNPDEDQIKYIGMYESDLGNYKYFYESSSGDSEEIILMRFFNYLHDRFDQAYNTVILEFHNGFEFDLPFIITRSILHGLGRNCPFYYPYKMVQGEAIKKLVTYRTAQLFGSPVQYNDIRFRDINNNPKYSVNIIDTYHQLLAWDFVARKLSSRSLKKAPYELKLISTPRTELSYEQLLEAYKRKDHDLVIKYLKDDLEATYLLGEFLISDIYYQTEIFSGWNLQTLATTGNATKWNSALLKQYGYKWDNEEIIPSDRLEFKGGYTFGIPGLFKQVFKIDVSSLYPTIMFLYGIYAFDKDPLKWSLAMLKYATEKRLFYKDLAEKTGDVEAKKKSNAQKVPINSLYGTLGATGIPFNDYRAAALVTGYGQAIVQFMIELCEDVDGTIIECDTDGLIVTTSKHSPEYIHQYVQDKLPKGIVIKLETKAEYAFISPSDKEDAKNTKNYIIFYDENNVEVKGKYKKRDRCKLEKQYQIEIIKQYCYGSKENAKEYHEKMLNDIITGRLDLDLIRITRKVASNEKTVVDEGLAYRTDEGVLMTTYYITEKIDYHKKTGKALKPKQKKTNSAPYSVNYYQTLVTKLYNDVINNVKF